MPRTILHAGHVLLLLPFVVLALLAAHLSQRLCTRGLPPPLPAGCSPAETPNWPGNRGGRSPLGGARRLGSLARGSPSRKGSARGAGSGCRVPGKNGTRAVGSPRGACCSGLLWPLELIELAAAVCRAPCSPQSGHWLSNPSPCLQRVEGVMGCYRGETANSTPAACHGGVDATMSQPSSSLLVCLI